MKLTEKEDQYLRNTVVNIKNNLDLIKTNRRLTE